MSAWVFEDGSWQYHTHSHLGPVSEEVPCHEGYGDANDDGELNVLDIIVIVNEILYPSADPGECAFEAMDANEDSVINVVDVVTFVSVILYG